MPYVPQQAPGFLQDFDALRKWTEEEFQRLARAYADDALLDAQNLEAVQTRLATADDIVSGSGTTALTTNIAAQIATIAVPIGTWDIEGLLQFSGAGATNNTNAQGSIHLTTATIGATLPDTALWRDSGGIVDHVLPMRLGTSRVTLVAPTNYFLNALAIFTIGTFGVSGLLTARRILV